MKIFITFFLSLITVMSVLSQSNILDGDKCFDNGDYYCAITKYDTAFKNSSGIDKQIAEIKLRRATFCDKHIKTANEAFYSKNYSLAKDEYQKVLDSNPKDSYVITQLEKCNNALSFRSTLSVSKESLSFDASGGRVTVTVSTNANSYSIKDLPSWCSVQKFNGYFDVTCVANSTNQPKNDFFTVIADDKSKRINVNQLALRIATTADLKDIWNNKYGVSPQRRLNLINAGIDPDDAQSRINKGEGKPTDNISEKEKTREVVNSKESKPKNGKSDEYLKLLVNNIIFQNKGNIKIVDLETNADDYEVTDLPTWCRVKTKDKKWFSLICDENRKRKSRSATIKVKAGDKEVDLFISQSKKDSDYKDKKKATNPPTNTTKTKIKTTINGRSSFFALGLEGGRIAPYGLRMEFLDDGSIGMFLNVRSSFISSKKILEQGNTLNKNETIIGLNFRISDVSLLNVGAGVGFYNSLVRLNTIQKIIYYPIYGGVTFRLGDRINLSLGSTLSGKFLIEHNVLHEVSIGLTVNLLE